ncbi:hypothetical protein HDU93_009005, partial [Gonapodya sp. JEL0774]
MHKGSSELQPIDLEKSAHDFTAAGAKAEMDQEKDGTSVLQPANHEIAHEGDGVGSSSPLITVLAMSVA